MRGLVLLLATVAACGWCDVETEMGVTICTGGMDVDPETVDVYLAETIAAVQAYDPATRAGDTGSALQNLQIQFLASKIDCPQSRSGKCLGTLKIDDCSDMQVVWSPCISDTKLVHEMIHWVYCHTTGDPLPVHPLDLFTDDDSLELRLSRDLEQTTCHG